MRLNHLDILEQVFREKWRGYSKQEVETFLHLVADDFKEMSEEIELLNKKLAYKEKTIKELSEAKKEDASGDVQDALRQIEALKKQLEEKDRHIEELRKSTSGPVKVTPEMLKEKAKKVIQMARDQAEKATQKAEQELSSLHNDIQQLKLQKKNLLEVIKNTAKEHLDRLP